MRTILTSTLLLITLAMAAQEKNKTDYLAIIDKALYMEYADLKMEVLKNDKVIKYYVMEFYRKEDKMRMEMTEPATEKGRRMLNDDTNLWMYMPRTSKVMKLPLKQAFMGSDASNRDLMRVAFKKDYEITSTEKVNDTIICLELKAKDLSVSYHKVIIWFDMQMQVPIKQEMYSVSNKLIKTMEYGFHTQTNGEHIPSTTTIREELLKNSLTQMYYENVKRTNNKPSVFFTLGSIKQ